MTFDAGKRIRELESQERLRVLRELQPLQSCRAIYQGQELHLFSTNDYLGMSRHPSVKDALVNAAKQHGMGPRGAALICGYSESHQALECELAALKDMDEALLFPTGFQANLGVLSALGGESTEFFSDALNHASIIDGIRLSRSPVSIYEHRNVDHLRRCLRESSATRKVVVTDALFSMDGTLAPLADIVQVAREQGALVVVDEAHSTLLYGSKGGGWSEACGVAHEIDFHVGTLSKAFGSQGGFVACSSERRLWLLNVARSFIFTTALPLPLVEAARAALRTWSPSIVAEMRARIDKLESYLEESFQSPIVPFIVGDEGKAMNVSTELWESGFHVPAVRPPTVPVGTSRLRIALSRAHEIEVVDELGQRLASVRGS